MAIGEPSARDLARLVGQRMRDRGCDVGDDADVAELVLLCWARRLRADDVVDRGELARQ